MAGRARKPTTRLAHSATKDKCGRHSATQTQTATTPSCSIGPLDHFQAAQAERAPLCDSACASSAPQLLRCQRPHCARSEFSLSRQRQRLEVGSSLTRRGSSRRLLELGCWRSLAESADGQNKEPIAHRAPLNDSVRQRAWSRGRDLECDNSNATKHGCSGGGQCVRVEQKKL